MTRQSQEEAQQGWLSNILKTGKIQESRAKDGQADGNQRWIQCRQDSLSSQFFSSLSPRGRGLRPEWASWRVSSEVGCNPRGGPQGWDSSLRGSLTGRGQSSDKDPRIDAQGPWVWLPEHSRSLVTRHGAQEHMGDLQKN